MTPLQLPDPGFQDGYDNIAPTFVCITRQPTLLGLDGLVRTFFPLRAVFPHGQPYGVCLPVVGGSRDKVCGATDGDPFLCILDTFQPETN